MRVLDFTSLLLPLSLLSPTAAAPSSDSKPSTKYVNWRKASFTGVNLGGWFVQEKFIDTTFWNASFGSAPDEWTGCKNLGAQCGPVLEKRYSTFITKDTIDTLGSSGVTILRIPTTYAAWISVPGSQLYHGNQLKYLRTITNYAINKYNMHIILDLHSLPGGTNGLEIGERFGGYDWFNSSSNLNYSLSTVSAVLNFITTSKYPSHFTLEPINEPSDNRDLSNFGTPNALLPAGTEWVLNYYRSVLALAKKADKRIPVMLYDTFKSPEFWSQYFDPAKDNVVFDTHNYWFPAARGANSRNVTALICQDAQKPRASKFPVFVGEWSLEVAFNNTLKLRERNLKTAVKAWTQYGAGSAFWTAKVTSDDLLVPGEGSKTDYWSWVEFVRLGFFKEGRKVKALTCGS
ncbi:endo-beta-1,3-glucanase [Elsinoe ampelina]|uniref:glucan 1,3-beta-glucosidase n=1 Tax=Elsinoe ampelina TaxID=302913 RepID=A0A6A6G713_9PEZI|nr:endo-beta-1,3-glucanase [Elsinoe ampelina]